MKRDKKYDGPWPQVKAWTTSENDAQKARQEQMLRQQAAAENKRTVRYEDFGPTCGRCAQYLPGRNKLKNSLMVTDPPSCKAYGFKVSPDGVCARFVNAKIVVRSNQT